MNKPNLRVKDVSTGTRVNFERITIVHDGEEKVVGGFTAVATSNVMVTDDGNFVRQFVDVDPPSIIFGNDTLWVVMEDDIAEDFFAAVIGQDEVDQGYRLELAGELVYQHSVYMSYTELHWLSSWLSNNREDDRVYLYSMGDMFILAHWRAKRDSETREVLAFRIKEAQAGNYYLVRRDEPVRGHSNLWISELPDADWVYDLEHWWSSGGLPPAQCMHHVSNILDTDEFWSKFSIDPVERSD